MQSKLSLQAAEEHSRAAEVSAFQGKEISNVTEVDAVHSVNQIQTKNKRVFEKSDPRPKPMGQATSDESSRPMPILDNFYEIVKARGWCIVTARARSS